MKSKTYSCSGGAGHLVAALLLVVAVTAASADTATVDLRFASTRAPSGDDTARRFLGNEQGALVFGHCTVRYEQSPREGRWTGYGDFLIPGDSRDVVAASLEDVGTFVARLAEDGAVQRTVLFVHGYAYGFERACRRVSDLQVVLGASVPVVLFSWPSTGSVLNYGGDRDALAASLPALRTAIETLSSAVGAGRLVVAAHSMGAWGTLEALRGLPAPDRRILATDLVLLAPDVATSDFRDLFADVRAHFERVTLYTSGNDILLGMSSLLNGGQRLGQGGRRAVVLHGMETVDLTALPRHHPGAHEYQYYNPHVVSDLVELLRDGRGAAERRFTAPCQRDGMTYWMLVTSTGNAGESECPEAGSGRETAAAR